MDQVDARPGSVRQAQPKARARDQCRILEVPLPYRVTALKDAVLAIVYAAANTLMALTSTLTLRRRTRRLSSLDD